MPTIPADYCHDLPTGTRRRARACLARYLRFTTDAQSRRTPAIARNPYSIRAWQALTDAERVEHVHKTARESTLAELAATSQQEPEDAERRTEPELQPEAAPSTAVAPVTPSAYFVLCDRCGEWHPTPGPRAVRRVLCPS